METRLCFGVVERKRCGVGEGGRRRVCLRVTNYFGRGSLSQREVARCEGARPAAGEDFSRVGPSSQVPLPPKRQEPKSLPYLRSLLPLILSGWGRRWGRRCRAVPSPLYLHYYSIHLGTFPFLSFFQRYPAVSRVLSRRYAHCWSGVQSSLLASPAAATPHHVPFCELVGCPPCPARCWSGSRGSGGSGPGPGHGGHGQVPIWREGKRNGALG